MTAPLRPGSLVFGHSKGIIGKAIRLGEWIRFRHGDTYNHVAVLDSHLPTGDWSIIQAVGRGVIRDDPAHGIRSRLSDIAPGGSYVVVELPAGVTPARVVAFAASQVGRSYGWLTILSVIVGILTPRWFHLPSFRTDRTWICSALAAEAARFGGWLHDWSTIYGCVPSEVFSALTGTEL